MEWWTHALYALAIVVVALIGWRAWRKQWHKAASLQSSYSSSCNVIRQYMREAQELTEERNEYYRLYDQQLGMYRLRDELYRKAEQSRRAYKGHNKRLRSENQMLKERVAELEGE